MPTAGQNRPKRQFPEKLRNPPASCYNMRMSSVACAPSPAPGEIESRLRKAGLRPTRQRVALAQLLFNGIDRHVSAEDLHLEAVKAEAGVSLATVYNTLNQFKAAGLLREVAIEGDRSYFDTNVSNHFHFFDEDTGELEDIEASSLEVTGLPALPPQMQVTGMDVIVRIRKARPGAT